jgi:hypothetical protein
MNEKEKPTPESQIKNLTKKLEIPQITLLQTKNLVAVELEKLIADINAEYGKEKNPPTEKELKKVNELIKEFRRKADRKIFDFVDK